MEQQVKQFNEYVEHFVSRFGNEDMVKHIKHFKIELAKQDLCNGLRYYLGDKAKWLPEYDEVADWLEDNHSKGLLCMGNCGRGKTLICSKIIPIILYKHFNLVTNRYSMQDLANDLDKALELDLLVIDDVGTEEVSVKYGEKRTPFAEIVDNAEKKSRLLIITSNLTATDIQAKYGDRVLDRLKELTKLVTFTGESMRGR